MTKNYMYSISFSYGKEYKGETNHPLKSKGEVHEEVNHVNLFNRHSAYKWILTESL